MQVELDRLKEASGMEVEELDKWKKDDDDEGNDFHGDENKSIAKEIHCVSARRKRRFSPSETWSFTSWTLTVRGGKRRLELEKFLI